jgi:hypothetical protein
MKTKPHCHLGKSRIRRPLWLQSDDEVADLAYIIGKGVENIDPTKVVKVHILPCSAQDPHTPAEFDR